MNLCIDGVAASKDSQYQIICQPYSKYRNDRRLKNGYRIKVWDSLGVKRKGVLKILNADTLVLEERKGLADTIGIGSIVHIKRIPAVRKTIAHSLMAIGGVGLIASFGFIDAASSGSGTASSLYGALAFASIILFTPIELIGLAINSGKHYRSKKYRFKIVQVRT